MYVLYICTETCIRAEPVKSSVTTNLSANGITATLTAKNETVGQQSGTTFFKPRFKVTEEKEEEVDYFDSLKLQDFPKEMINVRLN